MASTSASANPVSKRKLKQEKFPSYKSHLSSSSSSTLPEYNNKYKYDVFLSFCGVDTRNGFTDHLYTELCRSGIDTFKDDEELDRGKEISPNLLQAIEDSRVSIIVFSKNYAASRWCLDELVHILECMKPRNSVFSIFYHVDPSAVRHQSHCYADAFVQHIKKYQPHRVDKWRYALSSAANISGWHLKDGREAEFIQKVVQEVYGKLKENILDISNFTTEELLSNLKSTSEDVTSEKNHQFQSGEAEQVLNNLTKTPEEDFKSETSNQLESIESEQVLSTSADVTSETSHQLQFFAKDSPLEKSEKPNRGFVYDVFLSFKVDDTTCRNFINHLYAALCRIGIATYMDDEECHHVMGKDISPELLQTIQGSKLFIIILSANYADSSWCLDQLVHILECRTSKNKILPIFYNVESKAVLHQTNTYAEAFTKHEENFKHRLEKVERWRSALMEVAINLSGWDINNRPEAESISRIVHVVTNQLNIMDKWSRLSYESKMSNESLVGIDSRVEKILPYLDSHFEDARIIGICGLGGIGKTTIAKVIYDKISDQFEVCCFFADIRDNSKQLGLAALQELLLGQVPITENILIRDQQHGIDLIRKHFHSKKVLLVLDDVDRLEQLDALAGNAHWFGSGSRIIITTRDEQLLKSKQVDETCMYELLNHSEALQLFSLNAFKENRPVVGYEMMCNQFIEYSNGFPLALEVLGSFLFDKTISEWKSALDNIIHTPKREISDILRISFDSLEEETKAIFLHIACFFIGKEVDRVQEILDCCRFRSRIGISTLTEKCMVAVSNNILGMHDLLQDLAWEIVHEKCTSEPGNDRYHGDIKNAMIRNTGRSANNATILDHPELEGQWNHIAFSRLYSFRCLYIGNKVHFPVGLEYLSDELKFFKWKGYPFKSLPSKFYPSELVELNLCHSQIEQLWKAEKLFKDLTCINLSHCQNLIKTPDLTGFLNLEKLILEGCSKLVVVHQSIGILKRLRVLNLKDCISLRSLPSAMSLTSLEILLLSGCSKLDLFQYVFPLLNIPCSIANMVKLSLRNCNLPEGAIPNEIDLLTSLEVLDLGGNKFTSLPASIGQLDKLKFLGLALCNLLESVPELPSSVEYIEARDCFSLLTFSNPLMETSADFVLSFINCCKLAHNQDCKSMTITWLKAYLRSLLNSQNQKLSSLSGCFDIIIPETRIPDWFRHQSKGPSVRIRLPTNQSNNNNNWIGFVFCVAFGVLDHVVDSENCHEISCQLYADEGRLGNRFGFCISKGTVFESNHLWLHYVSNGSFGKRMLRWNKISYIDAAFASQSQCLEVKNCGIRVVYKQDMEETEERKFHYICPPIEDLGVSFFSYQYDK